MKPLIDKAVEFTAEQLKTTPLPDDEKQNVVVATLEGIGNAIRHTATPDEAPKFRLSVDVHNSYVLVNVVDYGPGFNFKRRNMPKPLAEGGRGIPLMLSLCDAVRYEKRLDGNHLMLYKRIA